MPLGPDPVPPDRVVKWFSDGVDAGDKPELYLRGLREGELAACFDFIQTHSPQWTSQTFHLDSSDIDVTVAERPDVAALVEAGDASMAVLGADGITIEDVRLPLVEMFLYANAIQFFWQPSRQWTATEVRMFLRLVTDLSQIAPSAKLEVDRRYSPEIRQDFAGGLSEYLALPVSPYS